MTPKYLQPTTAPAGDRWMISYVDVLTILLIFFVAAAAQTLPKQSSAQPIPASKVDVPAPKVEVPAPKVEEPRQALVEAQHKLQEYGLDLNLEPRGLVISLPQAILFASGDDEITTQALPIVEEITYVLRDLPNRVSLIGHADAVPIHNRRFKNNWELSAARGLRLLDLLSTRYGIPESRLSVASEGSYKPKSPNDTPDGRASNRRVEIVILDEPAP
jgi:chemotaxis protein MotB